MRFSLPARTTLTVISLLLWLGISSCRLQAADESAYVLHDSVQEVRLAFAATDHEGHRITSLRSSDVAIADNGWIVRDFRSFRPASEMPLDLVLLLDVSLSAESELHQRIAVITSFLAGPEWGVRDRISVLVFGGTRPQLVCVRNCGAADLGRKLNFLHAEGDTPLYDALLRAVGILEENRDPELRPAMILVSDGRDTISRSCLKDVLRGAQEFEVPIYAVNTGSARNVGDEGDRVLYQLAEGTGGVSFAPGEKLMTVLRAVLEDLRSGYVLTYQPPERRSGRHSVRLLPAGNPTLRFRSRQSYEQE